LTHVKINEGVSEMSESDLGPNTYAVYFCQSANRLTGRLEFGWEKFSGKI